MEKRAQEPFQCMLTLNCLRLLYMRRVALWRRMMSPERRTMGRSSNLLAYMTTLA